MRRDASVIRYAQGSRDFLAAPLGREVAGRGARVLAEARKGEGPAYAPLPVRGFQRAELGGDAVLVRHDLAARDLGRVRERGLEPLVADPAGGELCRLVGLLGSLKESE